MKKILALVVIIALALSAVQPAMACGERRGPSRCCPCQQKTMTSLSCCCESEKPVRDTSPAPVVTSTDSQVLNLPAEQTVLTTLVAGSLFRLEEQPGDRHAVLPPLFILGGAFLS